MASNGPRSGMPHWPHLTIESDLLLLQDISSHPEAYDRTSGKLRIGDQLVYNALAQGIPAVCALCKEQFMFPLSLNTLGDINSPNLRLGWTIDHVPFSIALRTGESILQCQIKIRSRELNPLLPTSTQNHGFASQLHNHEITAQEEIRAVFGHLIRYFNTDDSAHRFRLLVSQNCNLRVEVGNFYCGFPIETLQNVVAMYTACSRQLDSIHPVSRIYETWCPPEEYDAQAAWLRQAKEANSLHLLRNFLGRYGGRCYFDLSDVGLSADDPLQVPSEERRQIGFVQHAGTLDAESIVAWSDVLVHLVQFAHGNTIHDIEDLCVGGLQKHDYDLSCLLQTIGCSEQTQRHYSTLQQPRPERATTGAFGDLPMLRELCRHVMGTDQRASILGLNTAGTFQNVIQHLVEAWYRDSAPLGVRRRMFEKLVACEYGAFPETFFARIPNLTAEEKMQLADSPAVVRETVAFNMAVHGPGVQNSSNPHLGHHTDAEVGMDDAHIPNLTAAEKEPLANSPAMGRGAFPFQLPFRGPRVQTSSDPNLGRPKDVLFQLPFRGPRV